MIFSRHCDKLHISSCGHSHQVYTATTCFGGESVGYICWWRWTYDCVVMWPLSLIFIFALMGSKDNKFRQQTQLLDNGPEVCSKRSVREVTRLQKIFASQLRTLSHVNVMNCIPWRDFIPGQYYFYWHIQDITECFISGRICFFHRLCVIPGGSMREEH